MLLSGGARPLLAPGSDTPPPNDQQTNCREQDDSCDITNDRRPALDRRRSNQKQQADAEERRWKAKPWRHHQPEHHSTLPSEPLGEESRLRECSGMSLTDSEDMLLLLRFNVPVSAREVFAVAVLGVIDVGMLVLVPREWKKRDPFGYVDASYRSFVGAKGSLAVRRAIAPIAGFLWGLEIAAVDLGAVQDSLIRHVIATASVSGALVSGVMAISVGLWSLPARVIPPALRPRADERAHS